jgi:integrase
MASISKRGKKYIVRWRDPDGIQRTRTVPDYETAKALVRDTERVNALGKRWEPEDATALPSLIEIRGDVATGGLFHDFLGVARGLYAPGTVRHYDRALREFLVYLERLNPKRRALTVDLLTRDVVQSWFGELRERLSVSSARLLVGAVYAAWDWAEDSDKYGEYVARPRRFDMPTPTTTPASAPSWEEMDRCIAAARTLAETEETPHGRRGYAWRARLLVLLRFTGLRVDEQAMQLLWSDVDLDAREITIRGELGKSARERLGRVIPISAHLASELAGWGTREGYLLAPWRTDRHSTSAHVDRCWRAATVPEKVWGAAGGRARGSAHHAFRRGFKTGLARLGVPAHVRDYLVGHHRGVDDHYLDSMQEAREAVGMLPPLSCDQGVIALDFSAEKSKRGAT